MAGKRSGISRREFARGAALASAVGVIAPIESLTAKPLTVPGEQQPDVPNAPKLSAQSQAEAESRYDAILKQYGDRFSDEQKKDLRRLCHAAQPPLDRLRAYAVQNGDSPALYFDPIVVRDKKPTAVVAPTPVKKP